MMGGRKQGCKPLSCSSLIDNNNVIVVVVRAHPRCRREPHLLRAANAGYSIRNGPAVEHTARQGDADDLCPHDRERSESRGACGHCRGAEKGSSQSAVVVVV